MINIAVICLGHLIEHHLRLDFQAFLLVQLTVGNPAQNPDAVPHCRFQELEEALSLAEGQQQEAEATSDQLAELQEKVQRTTQATSFHRYECMPTSRSYIISSITFAVTLLLAEKLGPSHLQVQESEKTVAALQQAQEERDKASQEVEDAKAALQALQVPLLLFSNWLHERHTTSSMPTSLVSFGRCPDLPFDVVSL